MRASFQTILLALGLGLGLAAPSIAAGTDDGAGATAKPLPRPYFGYISVAKGRGRLVKLPRPVANLFVADESVASARPASPDTMFIFGKATGETDIVATDSDGHRIAQYSITVEPSGYAANQVERQAPQLAPGSDVTAMPEANGTILRGTVNTPDEANRIVNQAKLLGKGTVINDLNVTQPIQVELKVRIAQMSRTVTRSLGINWSSVGTSGIDIGKFLLSGTTSSAASVISGATPGSVGVTFPGGTFEGVIDALAQDNLAHILAEPTLTTLSGTQASFQVGGQFPVPVDSGNNAVSVSWKNYGLQLTFTPTVFSDGRIALQVSPEISQKDTSNSATITATGSNESVTVPSVTTTSATSTVILGSGQGMAIAGLLEDNTDQVDNGVPGLSEVPLLGALFRGDGFQRVQQELVITVTPYIVNPVDHPSVIASPDDGWTPPNDLQRILLLRDNGTDSASASIPGDAGFIVK